MLKVDNYFQCTEKYSEWLSIKHLSQVKRNKEFGLNFSLETRVMKTTLCSKVME